MMGGSRILLNFSGEGLHGFYLQQSFDCLRYLADSQKLSFFSGSQARFNLKLLGFLE